MTNKILQEDRFLEAINKFNYLFDNPRNWKLFCNFCRFQFQIKNNYFEYLSQSIEKELFERISIDLKKDRFREERFFVIQYILFSDYTNVYDYYKKQKLITDYFLNINKQTGEVIPGSFNTKFNKIRTLFQNDYFGRNLDIYLLNDTISGIGRQEFIRRFMEESDE